MKRKISARLLCLIIALVVLGGAVAYAAVLGSPYETLKNALFDAAAYTNATLEGQVAITVNGMVLESEKLHAIIGDNSSLSYAFDENGSPGGFTYSANGLYIYPSYVARDDTRWYLANISDNNNMYYSSRGILGIAISPEERNSSQVRFVELLIDALVGDLKNNITMTAGDGVRIVRGTLTENQVPELVKAGIDVLIEQANGYYYESRDVSFDGKEYIYEDIRIASGMKFVTTWKHTGRLLTPDEEQALGDGTFYSTMVDANWGFTNIDGSVFVNDGPPIIINEYTEPASRDDYAGSYPWQMPMRSLVIDYVHGEAEIDNDGNLLSINVNGSATITDIFGDTHVIEINAGLQASDIGTSNPVCPIPGAEQLLTADYMKNKFGTSYLSIFFKLNDDGSIDMDSITTTYPGELDRNWSIDGPVSASSTKPAPIPQPQPADNDSATVNEK